MKNRFGLLYSKFVITMTFASFGTFLLSNEAPAVELKTVAAPLCAPEFAAIRESRALDHLRDVVKRLSTVQASPNQLSIRDGKGEVTINYLTSRYPEFLKALGGAVEQGRISTIAVGQIIGPKVLNWVVRTIDQTPKGHAMQINGFLRANEIIAEQKAQIRRMATEPHNKISHGLMWNLSDRVKFDRAMDRLKIRDACRRIWKTENLNRCGMMRFEINTGDEDEPIRWFR